MIIGHAAGIAAAAAAASGAAVQDVDRALLHKELALEGAVLHVPPPPLLAPQLTPAV